MKGFLEKSDEDFLWYLLKMPPEIKAEITDKVTDQIYEEILPKMFEGFLEDFLKKSLEDILNTSDGILRRFYY